MSIVCVRVYLSVVQHMCVFVCYVHVLCGV